MTLDTSAWRANDTVAYDGARDSANTLTALLLGLADTGQLDPSLAIAEAGRIRLELLQVDGFDRAAVDSLVGRLHERIAELTGRSL